jgi:hypothetical protein
MWINKRKARAPPDAALAELNKYKVEEVDLDNNPDTKDNVMVYTEKS